MVVSLVALVSAMLALAVAVMGLPGDGGAIYIPLPVVIVVLGQAAYEIRFARRRLT